MKVELEKVIAERDIDVEFSDERKSVVRVRLGFPIITTSTPHPSVIAPYQIIFEGRTRTFRAMGVDGFQALQLAMRMIEVELESLELSYGVRMSADDEAGLGIRYR